MELNKIYLGDCYELIKQIPDNSVDLIYTDPPYLFQNGGFGSGMFKDKKCPYGDIRNTILVRGIDNSILDEFVRVMKRINIYIWCNKAQVPEYLNFFAQYDCLFEILTWHKTNPTPITNNTFLPDTEYCLYFRERGVLLNDGYELKSKFHISNTNKNDKDDFHHPTIKPLELVKRHILHSTAENALVLDTFIGSGTTAIACRELNRQFIGFEIDPKWHKIAVDRLNNIDANGQISMLAR